MEKVVRPIGAGYIFYLSIKYFLLIGLLSGIIFALISEDLIAKNKILVMAFLFCTIALILVLIIIQTFEILRYKLIIKNNCVIVKANRDLFLVRHKDLIIKYEGTISLRYTKTMRPDLIEKGSFFFSGIIFKKSNNEELLLTSRFSKKQIYYILEEIKSSIEEYNGTSVEIISK